MPSLLDGILTRDIAADDTVLPQRKILAFDSGFGIQDQPTNDRLVVSAVGTAWQQLDVAANIIAINDGSDLNLGASGLAFLRYRRIGTDHDVHLILSFAGSGRSWGTGNLLLPLNATNDLEVDLDQMIAGIEILPVEVQALSSGRLIQGTATAHYVQIASADVAAIQDPPNTIFQFRYSVPLEAP